MMRERIHRFDASQQIVLGEIGGLLPVYVGAENSGELTKGGGC
jgi:hypothetical protein